MNDEHNEHDYSQQIQKLEKDDDPAFANAARQKFIKKSKLSRIFKSKPRPSESIRAETSSSSLVPPLDNYISHSTISSISIATPPLAEQFIHRLSLDAAIPITLDGSRLAGDIYADHYEWAILYENQRGLTAFSTPYYSSLSLLPTDPSPFTQPNAPLARSKQPPVTLENYPLPDGNWRWVSRCWMIDMRSDSGEVQYDGFEYNWMFRKHGWRPRVGSFNAGGWVRRRRWVRLMVRPAKANKEDLSNSSGPPTIASASRGPTPSNSISNVKRAHRQSLVSSLLQSSLHSRSTGYTGQTDPWAHILPEHVWLGDDSEADWQRCINLMKRLGRDGRKLELWSFWLGAHQAEKEQTNEATDPPVKQARRQKQWTEDDTPMPSEVGALDSLSQTQIAVVPRAYLIPVLKHHTASILQQFIYPETRAQFIKLLIQANFISEIKEQLPLLPSEIDFWSYAEGIGALLKPEFVDKPESSTLRPRSLLSTPPSTPQASPVRLAASEGAIANIRISPFKPLVNPTRIPYPQSGSHLADVD